MHYLLQWFSTDHLRDDLKDTVDRFREVAEWVDRSLPENPEKTTALRKLVEAKDCAVRAKLSKP